MNYPLFLSYQGAIIGNGFVAKINARSQVLASAERDGWWLYGVHPGGVAESGDTLDEAHARLGETLRLIFIEIAAESDSFDGFREHVKRFFDETADSVVNEWTAAVQVVRQMGDGSLGLPKIKAEAGFQLEITDATDELRVELNAPPLDGSSRSVGGESAANAQLAAAA